MSVWALQCRLVYGHLSRACFVAVLLNDALISCKAAGAAAATLTRVVCTEERHQELDELVRLFCCAKAARNTDGLTVVEDSRVLCKIYFAALLTGALSRRICASSFLPLLEPGSDSGL